MKIGVCRKRNRSRLLSMSDCASESGDERGLNVRELVVQSPKDRDQKEGEQDKGLERKGD